jgi:cytochrome c biogenesis protein CcmG/thiol:disulfide interchange protein DsbE
MVRYLVPLFIVLFIGVFLFVGLGLNPREVPSQFINKPAPEFSLQKLHNMSETFSKQDMQGKVWMLNVWASWCVACRQEHPVLVNMARRGEVPLYGLNYKDAPSQARGWLDQHGDPYLLSIVDYEGKVGIDYGVYGVPESFIIDKQGVIRHKVTGPLTTTELKKCVLPIVRELKQTEQANVAVISELRKQCA